MSNSHSTPDLQQDTKLANDVVQAVAAAQQAIHAAVRSGLKVTAQIESMHHVGHHHPEPLIEVNLERVITLP